jgi:CspA family cold shock protein
MATGTVKWFNSRKGYGFITPTGAEEGSDVFAHFSAIIAEEGAFRTMNEGDEVEFEVVDGTKGPEARDIRVTKKAPRAPRRPRGPRPDSDD